jgi:hypothetical protein
VVGYERDSWETMEREREKEREGKKCHMEFVLSSLLFSL